MQKCAQGKAVDLTLATGQVLELACAKPMPPLAPSRQDFTVLGLP